jgi:PTS system mannose-specific IIA component
MFGGTPSNLGLSFLEEGRVEVVTGVNLAMLIKLARTTHHGDLLALARALVDDGREAIRVASDLLRTRPSQRRAEVPE